MAKGAEEKEIVAAKILEMFEGSFNYDKHIRVPIGEYQIKVTLTCAKDNVEPDGEIVVKETKSKSAFPPPMEKKDFSPVEVTKEELDTVASLLEGMGLA